ncbi:MAG: hypothetical protein HUU34_01435 [Saprospiraceae bacterium]|nr:hypothetical protein [Saprospiraceae bacterium]
MSWRNIQSFFHQRFLSQQLAKLRRERKPVNLDSAQTVGLLFDASSLTARSVVIQYADELRGRNKRVRMLGYLEGHPDTGEFAFPCFSQKQLDWALCPKSKAVDEFLAQPLDVLLMMPPGQQPWLEYIAALSTAHLKVGPYTNHTYCFDVMIDMPAENDLKQFIRQVEQLLKKTNTKHEPAQV